MHFQKNLVPKAGFEPARVTPHAPQTCVSTRFHHFGIQDNTTKIPLISICQIHLTSTFLTPEGLHAGDITPPSLSCMIYDAQVSLESPYLLFT